MKIVGNERVAGGKKETGHETSGRILPVVIVLYFFRTFDKLKFIRKRLIEQSQHIRTAPVLRHDCSIVLAGKAGEGLFCRDLFIANISGHDNIGDRHAVPAVLHTDHYFSTVFAGLNDRWRGNLRKLKFLIIHNEVIEIEADLISLAGNISDVWQRLIKVAKLRHCRRITHEDLLIDQLLLIDLKVAIGRTLCQARPGNQEKRNNEDGVQMRHTVQQVTQLAAKYLCPPKQMVIRPCKDE